MQIRQALRICLLPDRQQSEHMERIAGCCRTIANLALDQRRWFARPGRAISYASQAAEIAENHGAVVMEVLRVRLGHKLAASGGVLLLVPPAHTKRTAATRSRGLA